MKKRRLLVVVAAALLGMSVVCNAYGSINGEGDAKKTEAAEAVADTKTDK